MDYFYAQLEEQRHPEAKGRVVAVCMFSGRTNDSGAVATVNYEGRGFGIHAGMPIIFAKKKAPKDAVFLPADREYYAYQSNKIDEIIRGICDKVVQASIDEWNIEDSNAAEKAPVLRQKIKKELNLTCTICVAPSILGAKMGAATAKPAGLLILDATKEKKIIEDSPVQKVPGIGNKTADALGHLGVTTVHDMKKIDPTALVETFGKKTGAWLHNLAIGSYVQELGEEKEQEEISRIGTLKHKTRNPEIILEKLEELEKDAQEWLMDMKKSYKTLAIIFMTDDMRSHTKSISFRNPRPWDSIILKEKRELVEEFIHENPLEIRRIGIKFGNFMDLEGQTRLF